MEGDGVIGTYVGKYTFDLFNLYLQCRDSKMWSTSKPIPRATKSTISITHSGNLQNKPELTVLLVPFSFFVNKLA